MESITQESELNVNAAQLSDAVESAAKETAKVAPKKVQNLLHLGAKITPFGSNYCPISSNLCSILGAILSSFNSGLNSAATLFSLGFYRRYIRSDASDDRVVKVGKLFATALPPTPQAPTQFPCWARQGGVTRCAAT